MLKLLEPSAALLLRLNSTPKDTDLPLKKRKVDLIESCGISPISPTSPQRPSPGLVSMWRDALIPNNNAANRKMKPRALSRDDILNRSMSATELLKKIADAVAATAAEQKDKNQKKHVATTISAVANAVGASRPRKRKWSGGSAEVTAVKEKKMLVLTSLNCEVKDKLYDQAQASLKKVLRDQPTRGAYGHSSSPAVAIKLEPAYLAENEEALMAAGYVKKDGWKPRDRGGNARGGYRDGMSRGGYRNTTTCMWQMQFDIVKDPELSLIVNQEAYTKYVCLN